MTFNKQLLDILCCPETKEKVRLLEASQIKRINALISEGKCRYSDGSIVTDSIEAGLITLNGKTMYRIDNDIPVMLPEKAVLLDNPLHGESGAAAAE